MAKDVEQRVIEASKELFFYYGYSKVTLDEVAIKIGISKKTIYNHFASKKQVLKLVAENIKNILDRKVDDIMKDNKMEYVDKLRKNMVMVGVELSTISAKFVDDLEKSAPDVWKDLNDFKKKLAITQFNRLFEEGQKGGHLLKGINRDVAVLMYVSSIEYLNSSSMRENLPKTILGRFPLTPKDIFEDVVDVLYEGCLSEENRKLKKA